MNEQPSTPPRPLMKKTQSSLKKRKTKNNQKCEEKDKNQPSMKKFLKPTPAQPSPPHTNQEQNNHIVAKTTLMKKGKSSNEFSELKQKFEAKNMRGDVRGTNLPGNFQVPGSSSTLQGKKIKTTAAKIAMGGPKTAAQSIENNSREDTIGRKLGEGGLGTNQGSC